MTAETHHKFTVFCKESNDTGTTWIETIEVPALQLEGLSVESQISLIQNLARELCCTAWYGSWNEELLNGVSCYCVIPGEVEILYFEDLSGD